MVGDPSVLASTVEKQAELVVAEMRDRWETLEDNTAKDDNYTQKEPKRMVDKMYVASRGNVVSLECLQSVVGCAIY
jgi:hypothetical protein